jgi:uncharacterized protein (DUF2267 family)
MDLEAQELLEDVLEWIRERLTREDQQGHPAQC